MITQRTFFGGCGWKGTDWKEIPMAAISLDASTNLKPVTEPEAYAFSKALTDFIFLTRKLSSMSASGTGTPAEMKAARNTCRVFKKAGPPVDNTAADSPGQDLCLIIDTTNNDLYLISGWSANSTFTKTKILNGI
jgi:hypothetical protein